MNIGISLKKKHAVMTNKDLEAILIAEVDLV